MTSDETALNLAIAVITQWGPAAKVPQQERLTKKLAGVDSARVEKLLELGNETILRSEKHLYKLLDEGMTDEKMLWNAFVPKLQEIAPWASRSTQTRIFFLNTYCAYKDGLLNAPISSPRRTPLAWLKDLVK
jgi:hypothetical protein